MSLSHTLFPHLQGFHLLAVDQEPERICLTYERVSRTACCPLCGTHSRRIHSRYQRMVWDLPIQKKSILLRLHVRKFYCDHPRCSQRIFTERIPQVTPPHGRYTVALR
jgi:transposase